MRVTVFAVVVCVVSAVIVATGIVAACTRRKIRWHVAWLFAVATAVGAYFIADGVAGSMDSALLVMDAGSEVSAALTAIDNDPASNCSVPITFVTAAEGYTHQLRDTVKGMELAAFWAILLFFGSLVAPVAASAACSRCCCLDPSSAIVSMTLAAIAAVVIAAGSSAACTAYIAKDALSADLLYLVDATATPPKHKLLPVQHIELLQATCSDAALRPIARFAAAGAFEDAYNAVDTGFCTETRNSAVAVAVFAWVSIALIIAPRHDDDDGDIAAKP